MHIVMLPRQMHLQIRLRGEKLIALIWGYWLWTQWLNEVDRLLCIYTPALYIICEKGLLVVIDLFSERYGKS